MTNKELIELNSVLEKVSHIRGKKFAYAVVKNKEIIKKEMEYFQEIQKEPHPMYQDYENERTALCINHSKKDDNGNVVTTPDNKYDIVDMQQFQIEFNYLKEKYNDVFVHMQKTQEEYNDFLNSESTVSLVKVSIDDLPDDIDANFIESMKNMLE